MTTDLIPREQRANNARVRLDMPASEYHALEAMSASSVSRLLRSPAHFLQWCNEPRKQSDAMMLGEIVHMGILEPKRFKEKLYVWEKPIERSTAADKKAREEEHRIAQLAGNVVVEKALFNTAIRVIHAVQSHPRASSLLSGAQTELSFTWNDPKFGIPCKSRLDALQVSGPLSGVIADLKTTSDASPEGFSRSAASYLYHAQAAMYWLAHEVCLNKSPQAFCWIAAETEPPFGVAVYVIEQPALLCGMAHVNEAMRRYAAALKSGKWSQYPEDIAPLRFPKWALTTNYSTN